MPQTLTLELTPLDLPSISAPGLCHLAADLLLPSGQPASRVSLTLEYPGAPTTSGGSWVGGSTVYYSDADGHLGFEVVQGLTYRVRIGQRSDITFDFEAPALASANLFDYILPHIDSIEFEDLAYGVAVGATVSLVVNAVFSDGTVRGVTSSATLLSANDAIATVSGSVVTGVSAGATTVSIDSVDDSALPPLQSMLEHEFIVLPTPTYSLGASTTVTVT